jgi:isoleucyl-tRNA synthetase
VLLTLCKVLAPVIPFLTDRMYQNLSGQQVLPDHRSGGDTGSASGTQPPKSASSAGKLSAQYSVLGTHSAPRSVHLWPVPEVNDALIDETLSFKMQQVKQIVRAGHVMRELAAKRVRQPLTEMRVVLRDQEQKAAVQQLAAQVLDELNIKELKIVDSADDLVTLRAKPNLAVIGPRYGRDVQEIAAALADAPESLLKELQCGESVSLQIGIRSFELSSNDVIINRHRQPGWLSVTTPLWGQETEIFLYAHVTPELRREGLARDVVRHVQQLRKDLGLNIEDRIELACRTDDPELREAIEEWRAYIMAETLCVKLVEGTFGPAATEVQLGQRPLSLEVRKLFAG